MKKRQIISGYRANSRIQTVPIYKNIASAANEYVNICYETAITGKENRKYAIKLSMQDYIRWLSRILSYKQSAPAQLYIPLDMYKWVAGYIGLQLYPLVNDQSFSISNRIIDPAQLDNYSKNQLYLCSDIGSRLAEDATHMLVDRGAILKSTGDGLLTVLSW